MLLSLLLQNTNVIQIVHEGGVYCQVQDITAEAVCQSSDGVDKDFNTNGHAWLPVNAVHDQAG